MTTSNDFGYVDESGNAFVNTSNGPVKVGSYAAGSPDEAFAFFTKRFDDLQTEIDLLITRIPEGKTNSEGVKIVLDKIDATLGSPTMIGDLKKLSEAKSEIERLQEERKAVVAQLRAEQKEQSLAQRLKIVETAEKIANSTTWKPTTEKFKSLLDEWKTIPRADKGKEQELWDRFRKARSTFDKAKRKYFEELEVVRADAVVAKRAIIKKAQAIADSTDWFDTSNAFKRLMSEWKNLPRLAKTEEEKLWKEFKELQDKFFSAKESADSVRNEEFAANLSVKEALLVKAEALLPVKELEATKLALRDIQEQWEKVGPVARDVKNKIEGRLRKVEDAVRALQDEQWHKSNPEVISRANNLVTSFENSLAKIDAEIASASAGGKADVVAKLKTQRDQTAALLEAARSGASQLG